MGFTDRIYLIAAIGTVAIIGITMACYIIERHLYLKWKRKNVVPMIVFALCACIAHAQSIDTVIDKGIYQSYFNKSLKQPIFVTYKLYHAGGDCSRAGDRFKNDAPLATATQKDYDHSGYDEGHLADSKDFAYDCTAQEATFRFYNCVPQTPNLNRGIWKKWETEIRKESQTDSLLVIAGSIFSSTVTHNLHVPMFCWKIVKSLSTDSITHVLYCTNTTEDAQCTDVDLALIYGAIDQLVATKIEEIIF